MFNRFKQIVDEHIARATKTPPTQYEAIVTVKGHPVSVLKVMAVTVTSNYAGNLTDLYHVTLALPLSEQRLLMSRAYGDLSVKLLCREGGKLVETLRLKGVVAGAQDTDMSAPTRFLSDGDDKSFGVSQLELMEEAYWNLRNVQVGNIYRKMDPLTALRTILAKTLPGRDMAYGEAKSVQYEVEPQQGYESILVPDNTEFPEVFDFMQQRYGVYSHGIGVYLQKGDWHLFRPFYANKFKEVNVKLIIYNLPKEQAAQLDDSLQFTPTVRTIVTGGNTRVFDSRDSSALNVGTGYRVGSIRALDGRAVSHSPGKTATTTSESFISQANSAPHESGQVNAKVPTTAFVDHDKEMRSKLAQQTGQIIQVTWHQSHRNVITPGMGVKFHYANDREIFTRYGVVLGEVYHASNDGGSMASDRMSMATELTLWLSMENNAQ